MESATLQLAVLSPQFSPSPEAACMAWSRAIRQKLHRTTPAFGLRSRRLSPIPLWQAVYIATPVFLHAPQTIQSLRAGKHVLSEKPMVVNEAEASSMVKAASETSCTFGVAYYRRTYPKVLRAKQLIAAGAIGKPLIAELTSHAWLDERNRKTAVGSSIQQRPEVARSTTLPAPDRCAEFLLVSRCGPGATCRMPCIIMRWKTTRL